MNASVNNQVLDLDTQLLAEFVYALNIARRQVLAYPAGHPLIAAATARLAEVVPQMLEFRPAVTLGVARDTLLVEGQPMDSTNPVFRDLARNLFNARVATLTVTRELSEDEISRFFAILGQPAEQLAGQGGLEQAVADAGLRGIRAQGIDFSAFSTNELDVIHAAKNPAGYSEAALLWKSFADGMLQGTLDPNGVKYVPKDALDPDLLAEIMNREQSSAEISVQASYEEAITAFLKQADRKKIRDGVYQETFGRLGDMVGKLNPAVRRQFLNSMLKNCAQRPDTAEALLQEMPQPVLFEAFEQLDAGAMAIPQTLMDVLGKLAAHRGDGTPQGRVAGASKRTVSEASEQLAALFSEDRSEYFVPKDYQDALAILAATRISGALQSSQIEGLVASLASPNIDGQFAMILLDMLERGVDRSTGDAICQNLDELLEHALGAGDFALLTKIYTSLYRHVSGPSRAILPAARQTLERFADGEFIETVLDGLDAWGKAMHEAILGLVECVGVPFAAPLLERLADEQSMSRRRLLMAALVRIGPPVQEPIAARLADRRWFFVRNLVVVLREINAPEVLPLLGRLSAYNHPKVQFEVMKTFLHYGDDRAKRFLLDELSGKEPGALLNAVGLAVNSSDPRVVAMLSKLLNRRLPAAYDTEVKLKVIKALEESATEDALPELARFLLDKKLFGGPRDPSLKVRAVAVLEKIGTVDAGILAGRVAQSATGDLAKVAENVLVQLHGKWT